jgi:hypothetical protein
MKRIVLSLSALGLIVLGLAGIVPSLPSQVGVQAVGQANSKRPITWDIAIDCRTWRFNQGISFSDFGRGDSFIANGKIYRGGTIPAGGTPDQPVFSPDEPGSIGTLIEHGTMAATSEEILAGRRPAFVGTWFHLLNDGRGLVADGPHPETGPMAVVGGMGDFSGASGELDAVVIGTNSTGCPNVRATINLKKQAPK